MRLCLELLGESVVDMTIQNCRCGTEMATLRDASNTNRRFNQESELFQLIVDINQYSSSFFREFLNLFSQSNRGIKPT